MDKVAIIGAGSWGTAVANLLAGKGYDVILWARDEMIASAINSNRFNPRYLKDVLIDENVTATSDLELTVRKAQLIVMATPSHTIREMARNIKPYLNDNAIAVSLVKGIEEATQKRMSEVLLDELSGTIGNKIGVLSGPNHAEEVSKNIPSATVVSSMSRKIAEHLQNTFMTPRFRVYANSDIVGVELGGAVKNVIAVAAGISDGLGYGDNTKSSLLTRGLAEMTRVNALSKTHNICMPITESVNEILYDGRNPVEIVSLLMSRGAVEEVSGMNWLSE
ncbi:MAG: NAD(P)-dependent glycerol-3-phosphate dehydrogenase [Rubrobacteridae bacterium]|nr:NAD(P)-dependent glycerol-3-phosphate dehydrogenase [Rubrobacteridae bacterium]